MRSLSNLSAIILVFACGIPCLSMAQVTTGESIATIPSGAKTSLVSGTYTIYYNIFLQSGHTSPSSGSGTIYFGAYCQSSYPDIVALKWYTTDQCTGHVRLSATSPAPNGGGGQGTGSVGSNSVDTGFVSELFHDLNEKDAPYGPHQNPEVQNSWYPQWSPLQGGGYWCIVPLGSQTISASATFNPSNPSPTDYASGYGAEGLFIR